MSVDDKENRIPNEIKDKINNNNIYTYKKDLWMYFESINSKFIKDLSLNLLFLLNTK